MFHCPTKKKIYIYIYIYIKRRKACTCNHQWLDMPCNKLFKLLLHYKFQSSKGPWSQSLSDDLEFTVVSFG